ncbi:MAG: MATE family efflux transporter [Firmicutes bacterium]|nr:MATE family efflux transporter [Bacillota bacterium]MDY6160752.1 MATE family efflux transporter [Candidatus Faecousia sp.]
MASKRLKKDTFYSELMRLVVPIAVQSFMLALVSVTDAVMLGRLDQQSMASVSQAGNVQFFLSLLVTGFSIGVGIMAAQYWGKGDGKSIEKIAPTGLKIILLLGGAVTLAALVIPTTLMSILTSDQELIPLGAEYLRVVAPSYFLCGITQVYFALLKNTGHTTESSTISSVAVVVNIVLNAIFIFGLLGFPAMGIRGAALATVIARLVELVMAVVVNRRKGNVQLRWNWLFKKADRLLYQDFLRYTMPVIGASLVWGIAYMSYSVVLGHMDGDAVAANSITSVAKSLISCLIRGVGGGAGIMIGNLLGANLLDKAKSYALRLTKLSAVVGIATGLLLVALTPVIMSITQLTPQAASYLKIMIVFTGLNIAAQSVNHVVLDGIFGAGGDAKFDMNTNIIFMWCICVPLSLMAAFWWNLPAPVVFCLCNMDEIIKLPVVFHHYRKYIWLRNITREVA